VDYLKESAEDVPVVAAEPHTVENPQAPQDPDSAAPAEETLTLDEPATVTDPLLRSLVPTDRNARKRVVVALLRAVLAERTVT